MKVALVYDRLNKVGGAEVILIALSKLYPGATWYTAFFDPSGAPFSRSWRVYTPWFGKLPFIRSHHEWFPWLTPLIFESFDLSSYDLVISVGSAEAKGVITKPRALHIHYCLTPQRYLYSHKAEYLTNWLYRLVAKPLRAWDQVAATRPDIMIAISEQVKKRIKKYYNRDSSVIYPPVDTSKFGILASSSQNNSSPYYLTVSRLVPYKKLDLLIRAFNQNGKNLVIVGTGSEFARLKSLARSNIRLVGYASQTQLLKYYQGCLAFIQVNIEDFGIAMVEAQAMGKPIIAYAKGGAGEIVKDGETGILFSSQSEIAINKAVEKFEAEKYKFIIARCRENALRFDQAKWKKIWQRQLTVPKS